MWKVRAEVVGEFVLVKRFRKLADAIKYADKLKNDVIFDTVEIWWYE